MAGNAYPNVSAGGCAASVAAKSSDTSNVRLAPSSTLLSCTDFSHPC
jgi:hypothetical protein